MLWLMIGTGLYLVETLMEWKSLNLNAKKLELFILRLVLLFILRFAFLILHWAVSTAR